MALSINLVNASVTSSTEILLPWTILRVIDDEDSVSDFFNNIIKPRIEHECELLSAHVGQCKNSLDQVDVTIPVMAVVCAFGHFMKYSVNVLNNQYASTSSTGEPPSEKSRPDLLPVSSCIQSITQRTRKDKLFNDLITFLDSMNVVICESEISKIRKMIVLPPILENIEKHLCNKQLYEPTIISHLLPSDHVQKYRIVNSLVSSGLRFPCILLIYSPGSNIGNIHFMWKVHEAEGAEIADCFQQSQSAVEQAKEKIPIFHSRAMRSAMYKKFGRISSTVKPAVLRFFYKDLTGMRK